MADARVSEWTKGSFKASKKQKVTIADDNIKIPCRCFQSSGQGLVDPFRTKTKVPYPTNGFPCPIRKAEEKCNQPPGSGSFCTFLKTVHFLFSLGQLKIKPPKKREPDHFLRDSCVFSVCSSQTIPLRIWKCERWQEDELLDCWIGMQNPGYSTLAADPCYVTSTSILVIIIMIFYIIFIILLILNYFYHIFNCFILLFNVGC